ncbi:hypothetical protein AAKU58_001418 [Oxalobacteraceae bacterium GrIS 1.18]
MVGLAADFFCSMITERTHTLMRRTNLCQVISENLRKMPGQ